MQILIVDAFSSSPSGRKNFTDFSAGVKHSFPPSSTSHPTSSSPQFTVEPLSQLYKYVYAYEGNEYTDPSAVKLFDKLDCIIIDSDARLLPWSKKSRTLLLLVKTAFFTNKPVFVAGSAAQFLGFVMATGGRKINVLNGKDGSGGKINEMDAFKVPKDTSEEDVFLDTETGDFFTLTRNKVNHKLQWHPTGTIGSHIHDHTASNDKDKHEQIKHSSTKKVHTKSSHDDVPKYPIKAIIAGEVKVHISKRQLRHYAFKDFGTLDGDFNFLAFCSNKLCLSQDANKRSKVAYKVLASSSFGPQVIEYNNMIGCQFHIRKSFPCSYKILSNFLRSLYEQLCVDGKIGISCKFLMKGDPNLKPKPVNSARPFTAPVTTTGSGAGARMGMSRRRKDGYNSKEKSFLGLGRESESNGSTNSSTSEVIKLKSSKRPASAWGSHHAQSKAAAGAAADVVITSARSSKGSASTRVDEYDPSAIAALGYSTPRYSKARDAGAHTRRDKDRSNNVFDNVGGGGGRVDTARSSTSGRSKGSKRSEDAKAALSDRDLADSRMVECLIDLEDDSDDDEQQQQIQANNTRLTKQDVKGRRQPLSSQTSSSGNNKRFSDALLRLGERAAVDMTFAISLNTRIKKDAEIKQLLEDEYDSGSRSDSDDDDDSGSRDSDDDDDDDAHSFDDLMYKGLPGDTNNDENWPPTTKTLNLSNIHTDINWGNNIKVDSTPLSNSQSHSQSQAQVHLRSQREQREGSRAFTRTIHLKTASKTPFNTLKKFERMAIGQSKDWYITNDNTPYTSSSSAQLRSDNENRREVAFFNVSGVKSAMRMPDKFGVVASGPYPKCGKVQCSKQLDGVDKSRWMDVEKRGWIG